MLTWDDPQKKFYETGLSHGILYVHDSPSVQPTGIAWEGLMNVKETPGGSEKTSLWVNNREYAQLISPRTFSGTVEAYSYPNEFYPCLGVFEPDHGIYFDNQFKRRFSLCYRTLVNNDLTGGPMGYKIHFVYNLLATPKEVVRNSITQSAEAVPFSWDFHSLPILVPCGAYPMKPVHKITIDSRRSSSDFLEALDDRLVAGDFLSPCDLLQIFEQNRKQGRFLAFARQQSGENSNKVNLSDNDGWNWSDRFHASYDIRAAVVTNTGRIIALGGDTEWDQITLSDDNGDNWLNHGLEPTPPSACVWSALKELQNGRLLAISESGTGHRSMVSDDNGINWSGRSLPSGVWWSFVQLPSGRLVGVGAVGHSIVSENNGDSWSIQGPVPITGLASITLGTIGFTNRLIAVAREGTGQRVVISDNGGESWTSRPSVNDGNSWRKVITLSNGRLFAVAANGTNRAMYSDDNGDTWTAATIPAYAWRDVVEGLPGRLVAVATDGEDLFRIAVSDNYGVNWTTRPATQEDGWNVVVHSPADPFS